MCGELLNWARRRLSRWRVPVPLRFARQAVLSLACVQMLVVPRVALLMVALGNLVSAQPLCPFQPAMLAGLSRVWLCKESFGVPRAL